MSPPAVLSQPELLRGLGRDGVEYVIRPFQWTYELAEKYFQEFLRYGIFTDHVPKTVEGYLRTMVGSGSLWFEMVNLATGQNVGFAYLTSFEPSMTEKRFISATFHAITWDAKAAPRLELVKEFLRTIFRQFRFHRLQAVVPLNKGGAIRTLKRLGFKDEGTMREAVCFNGVWFGVLLLSILESEVS